MQFAASIRYGGQLIKAADADYNSYRHLGLICPECKNPVFVRAEHTRTATKSGESIKVGQSFAHFKAKDPAQVLACENRVAAYNRQDLEKKASAAKNQRLKLLHRWFWDIYYRCFEIERRILDINVGDNQRRFVEYAHRVCDEPEMQLVIAGFRNMNEREREKMIVIDSHIQGFATGDKERIQSNFVKERMQFLTAIDRVLQAMIVCEVIEFLSAKRQTSLLEQIVTISKIISEQSPTLQQEIAAGLDRLPAAIMRHVIISLCFIDWAGEFDDLRRSELFKSSQE